MLNSRKAEALGMFELAKSSAKARDLDYDEALAGLELGSASEEDAAQTVHLLDAAQTFKRLGCDWHLRLCQGKLAKLGISQAAI